MLIVHVHVHVHANRVEDFKRVTLENARVSVEEPGVARFDILQRHDDPTRFLLVEVYRTPDDPARHKETPHYRAWRDAVESMMKEPRASVRYGNLFPADQDW